MTAVIQYTKGCHREERVGLFSIAPEDTKRSNGWKLNRKKVEFAYIRTIDCLLEFWMLHCWRFSRLDNHSSEMGMRTSTLGRRLD